MGDCRRFDKFADLISQSIPSDLKIADVAGGQGFLRCALAERGLTNVETWDKRSKRKEGKQRYAYFNWETAPLYDAVVAMHPDEGTDHSILYAAKYGVPAFICPCCAKGSAVTYWGRNKYHDWVKHLLKLAEDRGLKWRHFITAISVWIVNLLDNT